MNAILDKYNGDYTGNYTGDDKSVRKDLCRFYRTHAKS